jgi:hypothetical protein
MRLTLAGALCLFVLFAAAGAAAPSPAGNSVVSPGARVTGRRLRRREPREARGLEIAPRPIRELPVNSFFAAVIWFLAICGIGIATLPLAYTLFPYLEDRGAGFAKVLGLALATFLSSVLVRFTSFTRAASSRGRP